MRSYVIVIKKPIKNNILYECVDVWKKMYLFVKDDVLNATHSKIKLAVGKI